MGLASYGWAASNHPNEPEINRMGHKSSGWAIYHLDGLRIIGMDHESSGWTMDDEGSSGWATDHLLGHGK